MASQLISWSNVVNKSDNTEAIKGHLEVFFL